MDKVGRWLRSNWGPQALLLVDQEDGKEGGGDFRVLQFIVRFY